MRSLNYWRGRANYSGSGSRGNLLAFKLKFINNFIKDHGIESVLDFGCGDMHFASKIEVDYYKGIDIVDRKIPSQVRAKKFELSVNRFDEVDEGREFDLCTSIDVLYHLLEEEQAYLDSCLDKMINHSSRYLLIYAQDSDIKDTLGHPQSHLYNCPWKNLIRTKNVELIYEQDKPEPGTSAKFYAFKVSKS